MKIRGKRGRRLVANKVAREANPLRADPTRTATLRRQFVAELRRRFARLKGAVVRLILHEDALGLRPTPHDPFAVTLTVNAFDPDQLRDEGGRWAAGGGLLSRGLHGLAARLGFGGGTPAVPVESDPLLPPARESGAALAGDPAELKRAAEHVFGAGSSPQHFASAVGAPDNATVGVVRSSTGAVLVDVSHPDFRARRVITRDARGLQLKNEFIEIRPQARGGKLAVDVFTDQVLNARRLGFSSLTCHAAGDPHDPANTKNGYYTWARFGYDAPLPREARGRLARSDLSATLKAARNVSQLMGSAEGRVWWKAHGTDLNDATFDLRPGSRSLRVLAAYLHEREGRAVKNVAWAEPEPGGEPYEEPPVLSPDDEDALDRANDEAGAEDSLLTDNTRWKFVSDPAKVKAFQEWLKTQVASTLTGQSDEELWRRYAEAGFRKGAGRAFDDVRQSELAKRRPDLVGPEAQRSLSDFYAGTKDEFLRSSFARPVATEKIELLAGRAFDDLEGITDDMSLRMSRVLTDGLVTGDSPHEIAGDLADEVDIGRARAETVARTEIIRAHAEGQLQAMEDMGVEEVGVAVEWVTAGPPYYSDLSPKERRTVTHVCQKCESLEGVVLKLDEAHNLIPLHPNCRCAFVPANVGEDGDGQKAGKKDIDDALAEAGVDDVDVSGERPEGILNVAGGVRGVPEAAVPSLLAFSRFLANAGAGDDCGTGAGGFKPGNTCGAKGGGGKGGGGRTPGPLTTEVSAQAFKGLHAALLDGRADGKHIDSLLERLGKHTMLELLEVRQKIGYVGKPKTKTGALADLRGELNTAYRQAIRMKTIDEMAERGFGSGMQMNVAGGAAPDQPCDERGRVPDGGATK